MKGRYHAEMQAVFPVVSSSLESLYLTGRWKERRKIIHKKLGRCGGGQNRSESGICHFCPPFIFMELVDIPPLTARETGTCTPAALPRG